ncbi:MAG: ABC transporter permease [Bdellovibrionales bacterium]|jgi:ABC-2 type transport system permease protein|nr:ABC transporter permease [Bdellovibrionales bacterium]
MKYLKQIYFLTKKESLELLKTPFFYLMTSLFSLTIGFLFFNYVTGGKGIHSGIYYRRVIFPLLSNINFIFILIAPLLTMNLFSQEKKQNTFMLLKLSKMNEFQILMSKYLSCLIISIIMIFISMAYPIIVSLNLEASCVLIITGITGLSLSIASFLSVGVLISSLIDSPILSALITFFILLLMMILILLGNATDNYLLQQIIYYLSSFFHFENIIQGVVRSYNLVFYTSFVSFTLYYSGKVLKMKESHE